MNGYTSPAPRLAGLTTLLLMTALGAACSTTGGGGGGGNPDLITRAQIEESPVTTAFDLVERVRPRWLRPRTQASFSSPEPTYPVVYMDGRRFGEVGSLHQISTTSVDRIEFIDALDATTRFGTGHAGGVIHVHTLGLSR